MHSLTSLVQDTENNYMPGSHSSESMQEQSLAKLASYGKKS